MTRQMFFKGGTHSLVNSLYSAWIFVNQFPRQHCYGDNNYDHKKKQYCATSVGLDVHDGSQ